jgi:hypothetical protein
MIHVHIERHPLANAAPAGQLSDELAQLEAALASGAHLGFEWPAWMHRAKASVVRTVLPSAAGTNPATLEFQRQVQADAQKSLEFQRQVQADMQKMLELMQTMAEMLAAASSQPAPAAAPASLVVPAPAVPMSGEIFYPFPLTLGLASWR